MPTTYAHFRFGQDCIDTMPDNIKRICNENRDIFNFGVHGPDMLFYDLPHKNITEYGYGLHNISARDFFESRIKAFEEHKEKDAMLAYLLGFLSHFTLDSITHGYVERKKEVSGVSHNKIEGEWDSHLMIKDGYKPNEVDRSSSLRPNKQMCNVISYFFPFSGKEMYRACRYHRFFIGLLNLHSVSRYRFMQNLCIRMKLNDYTDLFVAPDINKKCIDSNLRLDKLRTKAASLYPELLNNFLDFIYNHKPLPAYFDHNFEKWPDYQTIEILPFEKEMEYVVK